MLFNSLTFILFFVIVLVLHNLPLSWRWKKLNLLVASYIFYAAWNPPFVILLWISTAVDWCVAIAIGRAVGQTRRRVLLVISLVCNLGLLGFFKYAEFALATFVQILSLVGVTYQPPALDIILPVGISFYTFQTLSYTLDVYRGTLKPSGSFLDFALFVTFFPQLVAGPIVRAADFLPQCVEPERADARQLVYGLFLLTAGLFQKIILANLLMAPIADKVYGSAIYFGGRDVWLGTAAFSAQILFDFAGYSTCAIGAAMCLGFALPDNFRYPYAAIGFSDFWRRWHISLSTWLRDYLYISLGGNRKGSVRTHVNLMLTMLIGGLWHGASWRFVVWGGLHGAYLMGERAVAHMFRGSGLMRNVGVRVAVALFTYGLVLVTWVFFRAPSFQYAKAILRTMVTGEPAHVGVVNPQWYTLSNEQAYWVCGLTAATLLYHGLMRNSSLESLVGRLPWWVRSVVFAAMLIAIALAPGDDRAFIYFQF